MPAKDVPNFIANRIGTFFMLNTMRMMEAQGLSIEEIDVLTGAVMGWPKTGTFRLADMVGIDVLGNVAKNFAANIRDERADVTLPPIVSQLMERKWLGDKTRQGFYKKDAARMARKCGWCSTSRRWSIGRRAKAALAEIEMAKSNDSLAGTDRVAAERECGEG